MNSGRVLRRVAIATVALLVAACSVDREPSGPSTSPSGSVGTSSLRSLRAAERFRRASPEVLALDGAVFVDQDERTDHLVFGVEDNASARNVRALVAQLDIPDDEYEIEITSPIVPAATLRDTFRPTQGGIQIHFSKFLCTLGFNVDHAGGRSFITNSHCTKRQGGAEGTTYFQPASNVDGTVIATEADDPVYFTGGLCPKGRKCRYSDASRAAYSGSVASNRGEIARTTGANNGDVNVAGTFTVSAQDNTTTSFAVGTVVGKIGRSSGWTEGPVERSCVNTAVSGSRVVLLCQTFVTAGVLSGDSGSPVFANTGGGNVTLLGIMWGGSSDGATFVFSPLKQIQDELGALTATK
ncbi:MAG TPA: hypothetical protein VJR92_02315 [Gemmatimonadaceae bacterium]|nr:hypothetical protein [Gemmatimonadaceae bacterium]